MSPFTIKEVEILLKTQHSEFYLSTFDNVNKAIEYLLKLQKDVPDLKTILEEE